MVVACPLAGYFHHDARATDGARVVRHYGEAMEMSLRRATVATLEVLMASGDIELGSLPRFNDALIRLVADASGQQVVVDIDGTDFIEDAALGLILGAAGRARSAGGELVVVSTDVKKCQRLAENGFDRAVVVQQSIS